MWIVIAPITSAGRNSTWSTNRRGMIASVGNSPPNASDASHGPMNGTDSSAE